MPANAPGVYALSNANVVRSNSRIAGCSAAPETTGMSGSASAIAATACSSWSGLRNDHRNETASASTPCSSTRRARRGHDLATGRGADDVAVAVHALVDADDTRAATRSRAAVEPPVFVVNSATACERDELLEAPRGHQPDPASDARREHVRDRGRAEPEPPHRGEDRRRDRSRPGARRSRPRRAHPCRRRRASSATSPARSRRRRSAPRP